MHKLNLLTEELPREKLIRHGPTYLTDVELLAIILRTGTKEKNVLELSREIISNFTTSIISRKTYDELLKFNGINQVKACQIISVFELSRRLSNKGTCSKPKLLSSSDVYEYIRSDFANLENECVMAIFINTKNQVIKKEILFHGELNYSIIEPRRIIKRVMELNADGFFLIHNHPSGDVEPSEQDIIITKKINNITKELNIRFIDHIIIGNTYYSMFEKDFFL